MPDLVNQIRLLVGDNGVVMNQIQTEASKTAMTIEDLIRLWGTQGMSPTEMRQRLLDDLHSESSRYFGSFKTGIKNAVYGAENVAASMGMQTAYEDAGFSRQLLRWQTNGINICPDCLERHGMEDTLNNWQVRGMPKTFGSVCGENCMCTLVPTDMEVIEPIRVGQAQETT